MKRRLIKELLLKHCYGLNPLDRFYTNLDWPGFGKQRQLAQQYVTADDVLWLDADEQVTPEPKESILHAVSANKPNVLYKLNRLSSAFGKFIYHSGRCR